MKTFIALILLTLALPASAQYRTAEEKQHARCAAYNMALLERYPLEIEEQETTQERIVYHMRAAVISDSLLERRMIILRRRLEAEVLTHDAFIALVVECTYL